MEDTLKPSMLGPIDLEPSSKPSTNAAEAAAYCASVISNLEGWRLSLLPGTREGRRATITQLDQRVRRLEDIGGIHRPPPMDAPSWDSLMWRVARLHHKMPQGPPMLRLPASPPHIAPTPALLRSTVATMGGVGLQSWAALTEKDGILGGGKGDDVDVDVDEDEDLIQAAAQFLSHLAGWRGYKIVGSFDLGETCKLALELSLGTDVNNIFVPGPAFHSRGAPLPLGAPAGMRPGMGPRPPRMGPPPLPPMAPRKACCGCCNCGCHGKPAKHGRVLGWMTKKYDDERLGRRTGVKARIATVFRKLAFWRRDRGRDTDSDASSISTRSTSTFA